MLRASGAPIRRFRLALRRTGCRPGELRALQWQHVFLDDGVLILPRHNTVTRQKRPRPRIIALPPSVRWLTKRN